MATMVMEKKKVKYRQPQTDQEEIQLQIIQKYHQMQQQTFRQIMLEEETKEVENLITNVKKDIEQNEIYLTEEVIEDTRKQIEQKEEKLFRYQLGFSTEYLHNEDVGELTKWQADLHQILPKIKWKVEDQCRAVYSGDGKYHEGIIKSIKYGKADVYFTDLKLEQSTLVTKLEISGKAPFPHHSLEMTYDMSSEERTRVTFEYFCKYMDITKNEVSNRNKIAPPTFGSAINTTNRQRSHVILRNNKAVTSGREIEQPSKETNFEPLPTQRAKPVALNSQRPITNEHGSILNDNTSIAKKPRDTLEINMTDTPSRLPNRFSRNPSTFEPESSRPITHEVEKANEIFKGNFNSGKPAQLLVRTNSTKRSLKKLCCPHLIFFLIIVGIILAPFIYIYLNFKGIV